MRQYQHHFLIFKVIPDMVHGEVSSTNEHHFSCLGSTRIFLDKTTLDFHECPEEQELELELGLDCKYMYAW
jgi:hypothetical protein